MSRVFLPQRPVVRVDGRFVDKYELGPAERFGRLVEVVPAGAIPRDLGQMMRTVESALQDYTADDYLLAIGDPIGIAMCVLVAARATGGSVRLLKWDRLAGEYRSHGISTA